jgi:predicted nucleic acid-binding protein
MPVVDASVFVAALKSDEPAHAACQAWLRAARGSRQPAALPAIALAEVAGAIARSTGRERVAERVATGMAGSTSFTVMAVTDRLGLRAAQIASQQRLRGCDAVYVALAEMLGEPLVTLDLEVVARAASVVTMVVPGQSGGP